MATPEPRAAPRPAGLAHVAAVAFLTARAAPSLGFLVSLPGGVALARAGEEGGARRGFGASLAAMLQSVAVLGPARLGVPLTQAISAPLLGRMEARGHGTAAQIAACSAVRAAQNALETLFVVGVITGLDAYVATYDRVFAGVGDLPDGATAALGVTGVALVGWAVLASTVQVLVYRRGLARWTDWTTASELGEVGAVGPREPPATAAARLRGTGEAHAAGSWRRFDPRALALAAVLAFAGLLAPVSWPMVAAAAIWLALAWALSARESREVLPAGLALATILAVGAFAFVVIGGLGLEVAAQRASRAALLVMVATWLRAAAGSEGLRVVASRSLRRLRRIPSVDEAAEDLDELGSTPRLAAAGRALLATLRGVRRRPVALTDAVLDWVRREAYRFQPGAAGPPVRLGIGPADFVLATLALAPAAAAIVVT